VIPGSSSPTVCPETMSDSEQSAEIENSERALVDESGNITVANRKVVCEDRTKERVVLRVENGGVATEIELSPESATQLAKLLLQKSG